VADAHSGGHQSGESQCTRGDEFACVGSRDYRCHLILLWRASVECSVGFEPAAGRAFADLLRPLRQILECEFGGVGAAHAVRAWPRWGGRRADIAAGNTDGVWRQRDSRSECELANILGAGHDVTTDVVEVVGCHLCGGTHGAAYDALPETRGKPLDLGD